jgi:hypothetical protein
MMFLRSGGTNGYEMTRNAPGMAVEFRLRVTFVRKLAHRMDVSVIRSGRDKTKTLNSR